MNQTAQQTALAICMVVSASGALRAQETTPSRNVAKTELVRNVEFTDKILGEERLIFVPENRHDPGSRTISVFYIRIPAQADAGLPPVVILPGGPGQSITSDSIARGIGRSRYGLSSEIAAYSESRDVLIVNQRGIGGTPSKPALPKYWSAEPPDLSKPLSFEDSRDRLARGLRKSIQQCEDRGFDLRGYEIGHLVDDVEAVRIAHGYERLALRGASFGSQWAMAYLNRYPSQVDRMLLSGVEPVDHGYDSPQGLGNVVKRVEAEARQSNDVVLPEGGLTEAVRAIVKRLETAPVRVRGIHPRKKYAVHVLIGADDFRHYLMRPILHSRTHSREMLELWPKFVAEIYKEDYQYLAAKIIDDRPETAQFGLLMTLVDSRIGISSERAEKLAKEAADHWLGDVNWLYTGTSSVCPPAAPMDKLRQIQESPVPVLLIQGTLDLATPLENAVDLIEFFPNGKLLTVTGGTHFATYHAASIDKNFLSYLATFMNSVDPAVALDQIPEEIQLPPLEFEETGGKSLFTLLTEAESDEGKTKR